MKSKCEYCGSYLDDGEENCPNCGALNPGYKRTAEGVPTTIEELKKWYVDHNLPDESVTRFFIGKDVREAKAFGIYKDELTGKFIVYKNKSSGVRVVRYKGTDEKYAVNELYLKLKEEMVNQKQRNIDQKNNTIVTAKSEIHEFDLILFRIKTFIIIIIMLLGIIMGIGLGATGIYNLTHSSKGYYLYNGTYYYYQSGTWYEYDDELDWYETDVDEEFEDNCDDYYLSLYYYEDYYSSYISNFSDSDYYVAPSSSSSSSSSDSDWDSSWDSSDTWDSSSTDWDSDW